MGLTVRLGDSLDTLAKRAGIAQAELLRANAQLNSSVRLQAGRKLAVPRRDGRSGSPGMAAGQGASLLTASRPPRC
jgi:LysM repeat protein